MSIDWWTLAIQAVNVSVLVWLLGYFFWRPVAAMIEQRRAVAVQTLADAKAMEVEAASALAANEHTRAGFALEREALLISAREAAERDRVALIEAAAQDSAAVVVAAKAAIEKDARAADLAWRQQSARLAVDIAGRLCGPLSGAELQATFVDRLIEQLKSLPVAQRHALGSTDVELQVVSAAPLSADDEANCRERIAATLGGAPRIGFATEPELIAGVELRGPHLAVSNSWRADLDLIGLELAHADAA